MYSSDIEEMDKFTPASSNPEIIKEVSEMPGMGQAILDRGIQQGMQQGMQQGLQQGRSEGINSGIKGIIELCKKLNGSTIDAVESVVSQMGLSQQEAEQKVKELW